MKAPIRVPLIYLLVSILWIFASDRLLAAFFPDQLAHLTLYKGWFLVGITAILLFFLLRREFRERDRIESELRSLAVFDSLTGLLNRACFVESLEKAIALAERDGTSLGVLFLDLDGFKAINDCHGHYAGDALLKEVGLRLSELTRSADCAARFGGDEFVVLVRNDRTGTEALAQRLLEGLRAPFSLGGDLCVSLTASIGYAIFPDNGQKSGQLLRAADQAMYWVKEHGKNALFAASSDRGNGV